VNNVVTKEATKHIMSSTIDPHLSMSLSSASSFYELFEAQTRRQSYATYAAEPTEKAEKRDGYTVKVFKHVQGEEM
jgi:hypothetical protein